MALENAKRVSNAHEELLKPLLDGRIIELTFGEQRSGGSGVQEELYHARRITKINSFEPDMIKNKRYRDEECADATGLMPKKSS